MNCASIIQDGISGGHGPTPTAPTATFTVTDTNATPSNPNTYVGDILQLTDTSTGNPTAWQWFINGALFSIAQNPTYYCSTPSTLAFGMTASNAFGSDDAPGSTVVVNNPD